VKIPGYYVIRVGGYSAFYV